MCDKAELKIKFSEKLPANSVPEALCRCCKRYAPRADDPCIHSERGACRDHSMFEAKKQGVWLALRAGDVVREYEKGYF